MQSWRRQIRFNGFLSTGHNVMIRKGARIANAVIWDNAQVASDAIVEQAIIGKGCEVHGRVPRVAVRSAFSLSTPGNTADIPLAMALQSLRWLPAETTVIPSSRADRHGILRAWKVMASGSSWYATAWNARKMHSIQVMPGS